MTPSESYTAKTFQTKQSSTNSLHPMSHNRYLLATHSASRTSPHLLRPLAAKLLVSSNVRPARPRRLDPAAFRSAVRRTRSPQSHPSHLLTQGSLEHHRLRAPATQSHQTTAHPAAAAARPSRAVERRGGDDAGISTLTASQAKATKTNMAQALPCHHKTSSSTYHYQTRCQT